MRYVKEKDAIEFGYQDIRIYKKLFVFSVPPCENKKTRTKAQRHRGTAQKVMRYIKEKDAIDFGHNLCYMRHSC